jgi:CBS domain-containing protein
MSVGQFCNRETVIVRKQDSIVEAAKLMRQHHVGSVIVVEDQAELPKPVGIVTDRDLVLEVLAAEIDPERVTIGDLTSYQLVTANEDDGLWDTIGHMRATGVRRMPVVDHQGQLVGIIAIDDLLEILATELHELTKVIGREYLREEKTRPPV